ncbi:MAG: hypothetical protein JO280_14060 [Mycobacteriaceae bacterium]|nr:hypothetical protein [Mycobacteriaceae bacterium]
MRATPQLQAARTMPGERHRDRPAGGGLAPGSALARTPALAVRELGPIVGNRALARIVAGRAQGRVVQREPKSYAGELTTERVQEPGHLRISEYGTDPNEKLTEGQQPSLTELFWVDFRVENGTLRVSARTVDPAGTYRSPTLKLGDEFAKALDHFAKEGAGVKEFIGDWSFMSPTEMSTNLAEYNRLRGADKTEEEAARGTPSGRIAVGLGFTEVKVLSDRAEQIEDIGDGKEYQRVQVSFSRPSSGRAPSGGTGGVKPASGGGGSTTKPATRAGAAAALVIMGASVALNWLIERGNEKRIKEAINLKLPVLTKEQAEDPQLGFLLIFKYKGGASGDEGTTASPRFESLGWRRAYTRSEAETAFRAAPRYETGYMYEFGWVDPLQKPSPLVIATPFAKFGLARFSDITKIEFQRAQFKEWGGFDTKGTDGPVDATKWDTDATAYRFLVLVMPSRVPIVNVNGRLDSHGVTTTNVSVKGGTVPAVDLDGTSAVTVWPADDDTETLFEHTRAIDDKENKLRPIPNIEMVRWLRPEQVTLVTTF